jgi:hypothetical protein
MNINQNKNKRQNIHSISNNNNNNTNNNNNNTNISTNNSNSNNNNYFKIKFIRVNSAKKINYLNSPPLLKPQNQIFNTTHKIINLNQYKFHKKLNLKEETIKSKSKKSKDNISLDSDNKNLNKNIDKDKDKDIILSIPNTPIELVKNLNFELN